MPPIRVLRIIARMNVGGPALQVVTLVRGLDGDRFETRLLIGAVGPGEEDYLRLRAPDVETVRIEGLGRAPDPRGDMRALAVVRRHVRGFRPHIVHTHTAKAGVIGRLAVLGTGTPATVHTFHGHLLKGYFSPPVRAGVVATERVLARRTSKLVAVGARVRDDLLSAGIGRPDQYVVVPPGVDLPPAPRPEEARQRLGLPAGGPIVGWVGRLTRIKRPDRLLEVARQVLVRIPDSTFVIAGEGHLLDELQAGVQALGGRVRFLGWRSDVETVYAACDAIVLTSDNEGMPVSLIEASMVGRPCVTTDVGSAREVVEDGVTGFVTAPDADALSAAVVRLLSDAGLRQRQGRAAADRAATLFSGRRLVADTAELYEELASGGVNGGAGGS